jgi:hypothetical protein
MGCGLNVGYGKPLVQSAGGECFMCQNIAYLRVIFRAFSHGFLEDGRVGGYAAYVATVHQFGQRAVFPQRSGG